MLLIGLSVIPLLVCLISLHELGHLLAAAACRAKPLEFGLGLPPRACALYLGNTRVSLRPEMMTELSTGAWIRCVSRPEPDGTLAAFRVDHTRKPPPGMETAPPDALIHEGRVKSIDEAGIYLSDFAFSINWLPLGGFVRIAGEEHRQIHRGLASKNWAQRVSVTLAGIIMNLLIAFVLLVAAQWTQMQPDAVIVDVFPESPAQHAGIITGDLITKIEGKRVITARDIQRMVSKTAGRESTWTIQRNQKKLNLHITHNGRAGVRLSSNPKIRISLTRATQESVRTYAKATNLLVSIPSRWIRDGVAPEISGPIDTGKVVAQVSQQNGITAWLSAAAVISLSIGVINMLPLPPLDGFRFSLLLLEAARGGRRIGLKKERAINGAGYAALLTLGAGICVIETLRLLM